MVFVMVTGEPLILDIRRFAICGLIVICITAPVTVAMHFFPPYLQYWQIPCYTVSCCVLAATMSIFNNMFRSLFRAATHLNNCFKVRNSRNFIYQKISSHSACLYTVILNFIFYIFPGNLFYLTLPSPIIIS